MPLTKWQWTSCQKSFYQKCHLFVKILKGWFCFQECVLSGNICDPKILNTSSSSSLGSVLGQILYKGEGDIAVAALIGLVITTQIEKMMSVKTGP